jgi:hypothetical protein
MTTERRGRFDASLWLTKGRKEINIDVGPSIVIYSHPGWFSAPLQSHVNDISGLPDVHPG